MSETTTARRNHGAGQVFQVGDVWKIRYRLNGRRVQEAAGSKKADAVKLLNTRLGAIADGRLHAEAATLLWSDLERIILDEHEQHRSYDKVECHVRRHLSRHFAGKRAQAIDYNCLLTFKRERLAEGASPSTVRYEISLVRTGLVVAHKAGKLIALPPMPSVHVENTRTSFFEPEEFRDMVKHLKQAPAAVATFMYWTGWRRNETLTREWRHVDMARGTISLEAGETKSGEGRTFPFDVLPELRALLEQQLAYTREVEKRTGQVVRWVFHRDGRRVISIRNAWNRACKSAGQIGKRPHDFRRSAVRRLERAGVSRSVAMKLVGHSTEMMYKRYAITNENDLREGLAKVVSLGEPKPIARIARA